ncbi:SDR family oxidoreductase [Actinocorallia longicatena]|uniref:SDR family oxidoreductase n=1 Tax=Actinocorallia longicatena TaxID=111803 RepID=A0ABP6QFL5_9ACTN
MRPPPVLRPGAVVAVTGGARGIGRTAAARFAALGLTVHIGDRDGAAETAARIGAHGHELDVTDRDSFAAFLDAAGPVDVLVNNAGIMPLGPFLAESDAVSRATFDVNTWGPLLGMRLVLPGMLERGRGHVVNVASMAGKVPFQGMAVYNASKYAAVGLSGAVREELAGTGVTVSAVLPTAVRTGLTDGVPLGGPLPTIGPEAVARAILRSCRTRRAEYPVPGWMALVQPALALVPERLVLLGKRAGGGDRAMAVHARGDHDRRVAEQAEMRSGS